MPDPFRIIQWGAGLNGRSLIRAVARHPDLELVGCRVWSEAKAGIDAGVLAEIEPLGVLTTTDVAALVDLPADVVFFLPAVRPDLAPTDVEICALLRSGKNVISLTGAHSMPAAVSPEYAAQFVEACLAGGSSLAAAGVNPGFIAERLAPTATGMCADVAKVTVRESWDCSAGSSDTMFDVLGFGRWPADWTPDSDVGGMFDRMFSQVIHNMARLFSTELATVRRDVDVIPADRDITVHGRTIERGQVAAVRQSWTGIPAAEPGVTVVKETTWACCGTVTGAPVERGWTVLIDGKPNVTLHLDCGLVEDPTYRPEAMVGGAIPMVPEVVAAAPGLVLPSVYAPYRARF